MASHFEQMARYNIWANERLYKVVGDLESARVMAPNGAYFDSIFGTLTHILIADQIWMYRLSGEGPNPTDLRHRPFAIFENLAVARRVMDRRILDLILTFDDHQLNEEAHYTNTRGEPRQLLRRTILTHFFNHQTHHRGQVHHMLSVEGVEPPPLDLLYFALPDA